MNRADYPYKAPASKVLNIATGTLTAEKYRNNPTHSIFNLDLVSLNAANSGIIVKKKKATIETHIT